MIVEVLNEQEIEHRFDSHELSEKQQKKVDTLRRLFKAMAKKINEICPDSREQSLAITHLESSSFWANAALARHDEF